MTQWEKDWYDTYKTLKLNGDTGQMEMMSQNEYVDNHHQQKSRCKEVLKELRKDIAEYESWKISMGPHATYMDGKVRLLKQDLVAWEEYSQRLFAAKPREGVYFDPKYPRNFYFA